MSDDTKIVMPTLEEMQEYKTNTTVEEEKRRLHCSKYRDDIKFVYYDKYVTCVKCGIKYVDLMSKEDDMLNTREYRDSRDRLEMRIRLLKMCSGGGYCYFGTN